MGIGTSRPSVSRNEILRTTQSSRDFMNLLFQQMITQITPEDYLRLGNPKQCQAYVFTMADTISKLFDDLRIRPKRAKDSGIVLFQKVDTLRAASPENKEICLIIAYFYIRIFQIFGALALTIIDDPGAGQVLGAIRYAGIKGPTGPARVRGAFLGGSSSEIQVGGVGEIEPSYDEFRRRFSSFIPIYEDLEFQAKKFGTYHYTFREVPSLDVFPALTKWNVQYHLNNATMQALLSFSQKNSTTLDFSLSAFSLNSVESDHKSYEKIMKAWFQKQRKITFTAKKSGDTWSIDETAQSFTIGEKLRDRFDKIYTQAVKVAKNPDAAAVGLVGAISRVSTTDRAIHAAAEAKHHQAVDQFTPKMLQSGYIIATLKGIAGQKHTAFCVARALQLVDANSLFHLQKGSPITSYVCQAKFDALPSSVPVAGIQLDRLPAFKAAEQLFYTEPYQGPTGDVQLKVAGTDLTAYAEFLTDFATIFGKPIGSTALKGLDQVIARDPNCAAAAAKHYLQISDPKQIANVMGFVKQLFQRQIGHTKAVLTFIKTRLFIIQKRRNPLTGSVGDYVDIHPKLLAGGIDEISKVSGEARKMLVSYYKDCESIYQKGAQAVQIGARII